MKELRLKFQPSIKRLEFFTRRGILGLFVGEYISVFKGRGLEFTGYRGYLPSDDAGLIDWKASLRSQKLLVRELVEERNLEAVIAFDVSSSMSFSSIDKLKNEYAAELIAALAFAILRAGDNVGLLMFTDKIVKYLPPAAGTGQYFLITRALSDPKLYDGPVDYENTFRFMQRTFTRNSFIIIVSDFIGLKGEWKEILATLGKKCDILGIIVRDRYDNYMPDVGQVVISDPFTGKEIMVDSTIMQEEFENNVAEQLNIIKNAFVRARSDCVMIMTDEPFVKPITSFFMRRRMRWR